MLLPMAPDRRMNLVYNAMAESFPLRSFQRLIPNCPIALIASLKILLHYFIAP